MIIRCTVCGFDIRGTVTEINRETGEEKKRPIRPDETVWKKYEEIFTDNYKTVDEKHNEVPDGVPIRRLLDEEDVFYHRVWTQPIT